MKKSDITGWRDVFSFTLSQTLKSKAFIITLVLMLLLILISMPLMSRFLNTESEDPTYSIDGDEVLTGPTAIEKVYVKNETTLPDMDFTGLDEYENIKHIEFEMIDNNFDDISTHIEEEENTSIILIMGEDEGSYNFEFLKASDGPIEMEDIYNLEFPLMEKFQLFIVDTMEINQDKLDLLYSEVHSDVVYTDIQGELVIEEDTTISDSEYWFIYIIMFVVMMATMMGGVQIANSIITEKSSKVVENLLISVRPLALIVGKVLGMLTVVLGQLALMVIFFIISNKLSAWNNGSSVLSTYLPEDVFSNFNVVNIILCFVVVMLGFIFYATLAGLTGSTVSKLEDAGSGMTVYYICDFIGFYIAIIAAGMLMATGVNSFIKFAFMFPLSSPFILPGAILVGEVSPLILLIAIGLLILSVIVLLKFTANVYETLILYNGNRIKFKELFKISRTV